MPSRVHLSLCAVTEPVGMMAIVGGVLEHSALLPVSISEARPRLKEAADNTSLSYLSRGRCSWVIICLLPASMG